MFACKFRPACAAARYWLVLSLVSLAAGVSSVAGFAERVEDLPVKPTDYVSDFAHVLTPDTIARLDRICSQLDHSATNAQVAIVTVNNLDGDDKADFGNRLEEKWKVGKKGSDRGILMLVSTQDRHYWIEVGYGLEGILPDAKVGDIGRAMLPYLKQGNYNSGITTGLVQIASVIAADAKVTLSDTGVNQEAPDADQQPRPVQPVHLTIGLIFRIIFILIIIAFFILRVLGRFGLFYLPWFFTGGGGGWGGGGGGWGGGDGGGGGGDGFGGFGGGESGGGGAGGDF